jgi:cyclopropane-fatty-acyl-phospholipid synthase
MSTPTSSRPTLTDEMPAGAIVTSPPTPSSAARSERLSITRRSARPVAPRALHSLEALWRTTQDRDRAIADQVTDILGGVSGVAVRAFDGSTAGPADALAVLVINRPTAFSRLLSAPGDLGFARAFVTGDLDIEGDLIAALDVRHDLQDWRLTPARAASLVALLRSSGTPLRPPPPPPEEARLRGLRHSRGRDAAAIAHHYDVGNDFYRLFLGPTMAYSCAVWATPDVGLEAAQDAKHELICRKLALRPGMRLLDVGCGWGGMAMHAARHHGVKVVGATASQAQAALARARVVEAGVGDLVDIRVRDYRDIDDGPFDAVCSIGMFEHVGQRLLPEYFNLLARLLVPGGRLLNHGIARPPGEGARLDPRGFISRYIFPDGSLVEVGEVVSHTQRAGLEVRHSENLREHYSLTLRAWLRNLEHNWDEAVRLVGETRARAWRLYLAMCAVGFDDALFQVHQVLAVKLDGGRSGMPLRPDWD